MFLLVEAFGFAGNVNEWHGSNEQKQFLIHNTLNLFGLLLIYIMFWN